MQSKDYPVPHKTDDARLFRLASPKLQRLQKQARKELRLRARAIFKNKYGLGSATSD